MAKILGNPYDLSKFSTKMSRCKTTGELLSHLLAQVQQWGFARIRYYYYSPDDQKLVSVDCAGHANAEFVAWLRDGNVVQFKRSCPTSTWDSFWCQKNKSPVVFRLRKGSSPRLKAVKVGTLTLIDLPKDNSDPMLKSEKAKLRVDCPLVVGNAFVGKLSCDFSSKKINFNDQTTIEQTENNVQQLNFLAQIVAPCLDASSMRQISLPQVMTERQQLEKEFHECTTLQKLYTYCTEKLPRKPFFDCKYASILTLSEAEHSLGSKKLILRKTSYVPKCKTKELVEDLTSYEADQDPPTLTTWVLKTGRTLRLHDLENKRLLDTQLDAQLAKDDPRPVWKKLTQDSQTHKSFLAVPLTDRTRKTIGVLRFTEKSHGGHFTERDAKLLRWIARDYIGPAMVSLRLSQFSQLVFDHLPQVIAISVKNSAPLVDLPKVLCGTLATFFEERDDRKKLYVINILEEGGQRFMHRAIGGQWQHLADATRLVELDGTMTAVALSNTHAVFTNDLRRAEERRALLPLVRKAACVLACRVSFLNHNYGAIAVYSSHHDINPETHGHLLEILAAQAGEMYARQELFAYSFMASGLKHDMAKLLAHADGELDKLLQQTVTNSGQPTSEQSIEAFNNVKAVLEFNQYMLDAHYRSEGIPATLLEQDVTDFSVREVVKLAGDMALKETQSRCTVHYNIAPDLVVRAYRAPIAAILFNLTKNSAWACDSPESEITIAAAINHRKGLGTWLDITIDDSGPGLSADLVQKYFESDFVEEFFQQRLESTHVKGFGVYLCRRLAYMHQFRDGRRAKITPHRRRRGGYRLVVSIPTLPGQTTERTSNMNASGIKVLIIDDKPGGSGAGGWADRLEKFGASPTPLIGDNSTELLSKLLKLLDNENEKFHGTILDIMYKSEFDGGITLWKKFLSVDAVRKSKKLPSLLERVGKLIVVSDSGDKVKRQFARDFAEDRCCFSGVREDRLSHVERWLLALGARDPMTEIADGVRKIQTRLDDFDRRLDSLEKKK